MRKYSTTAPPGMKSCPDCGETKPVDQFHRASKSKDGLSTYCKLCACARSRDRSPEYRATARARGAAWRVANPERVKAHRREYSEPRRQILSERQQAYYRAHREQIRKRAAAYRLANADRLKAARDAVADRRRATTAAWTAANAERVIATRRAHYEANAERLRAKTRQYFKDHPEWSRAHNRNRYAQRKAGSTGERVNYTAILARDRWTCGLCGKKVESRKELHFDHITPLSKQGAHADWNVQVSHKLCNLRKGNKLIGQPRLPI